MVGLRPEHDIDIGRAGEDLGPLGLRDAAGDGQDHTPARCVLQAAQAAEFGENFLRGLVTDVAGVQDDHVGAVRLGRRGVSELQGIASHHRCFPLPRRGDPAWGAGEMIGQNCMVKRDSAGASPSLSECGNI
jgi:hypothetical protein